MENGEKKIEKIGEKRAQAFEPSIPDQHTKPVCCAIIHECAWYNSFYTIKIHILICGK